MPSTPKSKRKKSHQFSLKFGIQKLVTGWLNNSLYNSVMSFNSFKSQMLSIANSSTSGH